MTTTQTATSATNGSLDNPLSYAHGIRSSTRGDRVRIQIGKHGARGEYTEAAAYEWEYLGPGMAGYAIDRVAGWLAGQVGVCLARSTEIDPAEIARQCRTGTGAAVYAARIAL